MNDDSALGNNQKLKFMLQINSSIALLNKDYDKLISLAKNMQEREEIENQLKKGSHYLLKMKQIKNKK